MKSLLAIASVAFTLCACVDNSHDVSFARNSDKSVTLTLPNGNGCTGKLKYTGGGYAAIHYNFHCNDGRVFINIENAEVR